MLFLKQSYIHEVGLYEFRKGALHVCVFNWTHLDGVCLIGYILKINFSFIFFFFFKFSKKGD